MRAIPTLLGAILLGSLCGCPGGSSAPPQSTATVDSGIAPAEVAAVVSEAPPLELAPQPLAFLLPEVRPTPAAPAGVIGARPDELSAWASST